MKRPSNLYLRRLAMHAAGMMYIEIAAEEGVTARAIEMSFSRLKEHIGALTIDHAVVLCIARGYLVLDSDHEALFVPEMSAEDLLVAS